MGLKMSQEKIFRGAYNYYHNDELYAEETFEVFRDNREMGLSYQSELISRSATGELFNCKVNYVVNKDYVPVNVLFTKSLGEKSAEEIFLFDKNTNTINYTFISEGEPHTEKMPIAVNFHIASPTTVTSVLYLLARRVDGNSEVSQTVMTSYNHWAYQYPPVTRVLKLQRTSLSTVPAVVNEKNVEGIQFKISESKSEAPKSKKAALKEPPSITVLLSKHIGIPYQILGTDGTRVEIKYLNNLDKDA
jgi:hypothetical protein